jgi:hypothetical protein
VFITSFARKSTAKSPCRTGRPFSTSGLYTEVACTRGLNAAGAEEGNKSSETIFLVYKHCETVIEVLPISKNYQTVRKTTFWMLLSHDSAFLSLDN